MNLIILVCAVLSANTIMGLIESLFGRFLQPKWWAKLIGKLFGLGGGLLYLYFAGYYIMDKEANLVLAAVIGLFPFVANLIVSLILRIRQARKEV